MHSTTEEIENYLKDRVACLTKDKRSTAYRPFITISRQTGAGGITVGRMLSAYLREHDRKESCPWTVFDKTLMKKVAEEHGLTEKLDTLMKEDRISEIKGIVDEMFRHRAPDWVLVRQTSETILHLAEIGSVILVGRGANIVTRKLPGGLHVRLVGSYEKRLAHVQAYYGFSAERSKEFIRTDDEGRKNYLKAYFGQNIDDPLLYDLVINTDSISYGEAARIIGHAALAV